MNLNVLEARHPWVSVPGTDGQDRAGAGLAHRPEGQMSNTADVEATTRISDGPPDEERAVHEGRTACSWIQCAPK